MSDANPLFKSFKTLEMLRECCNKTTADEIETLIMKLFVFVGINKSVILNKSTIGDTCRHFVDFEFENFT